MKVLRNNTIEEFPDDRQIYISARLWHEIQPKIDLQPFIFALHEGIDLTKYGGGLEKFYFTFIIVPPEDEINLPYCHYDSEKCEVDVGIAVSYQLMAKSTKSESFGLLEEAYLNGIKQIATLPLANFDADALRENVKNIFAKEDWYQDFS